MPATRRPTKDSMALRKTAEETLGLRASGPAVDASEADVRRLLHELQVHQIELEMQNAELQEANLEIEALLEAYTDLYEFAPVGYLTFNRLGEVQKANLTAASLLGVDRSALLGRPFQPWVAAGSQLVFADFLAARFSLSESGSCELAMNPGGGTVQWIQMSASGSAAGSGCRVALLDTSERHRADLERQRTEAELHHAQKLESLGSLAAGVSHDINNVLAAIYAVTERLKLDAPLGSDLHRALNLIETATTRGRDLVRGLTAFSRKDLQNPELIDLHALALNEIDILKRSTFQKVEFTLVCDEPHPLVLGQPGRLASTLMNLCLNGLDAMPNGGRLNLSIRRRPEGWVELTVEDTGMGMTPGVLARAREPFFTTKPIGLGAGLGLSMAYATAQNHGGELSLQSEPGRGTTVVVRLPETTKTAEPSGPHEILAAPPKALTILFADDDELIQGSVPPMLESLGHSVLVAGSGEEALTCLAAHPDVDLIILDHNMPGMTGLEVLQKLRPTHPAKPVLLATGNLETEITTILNKDGHARAIEKPFSIAAINAVILQLMK